MARQCRPYASDSRGYPFDLRARGRGYYIGRLEGAVAYIQRLFTVGGWDKCWVVWSCGWVCDKFLSWKQALFGEFWGMIRRRMQRLAMAKYNDSY